MVEKNKKRIDSINGLRGFSCLMILLYHYRFYLLDKGFGLIEYGHYFVEVFMAISGFVIAYNYRNCLEQMNFKSFILKRYFKIMPLFWLTEACMHLSYIIATWLEQKELPFNLIEEILRYSGFGVSLVGKSVYPRNEPLWTISCLLWCYGIYFIVTRKRKLLEKYYHYIMLGILFILLCLYLKGNIFNLSINYNALLSMISFFGGVLIFELYTKLRSEKNNFFVCVIIISSILAFGLTYDLGIFLQYVLVINIAVILVPSLLYITVSGTILKMIMEMKLFQYLGNISMDLYMWHWVVRVFLGSRPFYVEQTTLVGFVILVISAILMAIFSHYVIIKMLNKVINAMKI